MTAFSRLCPIVEHRYVFNLRIAENERSLMALVAGLIRMILSSVTISEKMACSEEEKLLMQVGALCQFLVGEAYQETLCSHSPRLRYLHVHACRRTNAYFVYNRKLIEMNSINYLSKKWSGQSWTSRTGSYAYVTRQEDKSDKEDKEESVDEPAVPTHCEVFNSFST